MLVLERVFGGDVESTRNGIRRYPMKEEILEG